MAYLGMDVDQVESLGGTLKQEAEQIRSLVSQINSTVQHLSQVWQGQDAQTFVNQWWPQHQTELGNAATSIEGLGQSALNNASDQRNASSH